MLKNLNLSPEKELCRQLHITLLNRMAEGQISDIPLDKFLTPAIRDRLRVIPTKFQRYKSSKIIEQQAVNNA